MVLALIAFVVYDMRHAALAYLGINPTKPAVEFEIRLPKAALTAVADTQIELRTDRNQKLAQVQDALASTSDGRSVLKGTVTLDYRTTERMVVLNLPGQAQRQFRLRLPASPSHSDEFGPWHLADGIVPANGDTVDDRDPRRLRDPLSRALSRCGHKRPAALMLAALIGLPLAAMAAPADIAICDRLAAHPEDQDKPSDIKGSHRHRRYRCAVGGEGLQGGRIRIRRAAAAPLRAGSRL